MLLAGPESSVGECTNVGLMPACLLKTTKQENDAYLKVEAGINPDNVIIIHIF